MTSTRYSSYLLDVISYGYAREYGVDRDERGVLKSRNVLALPIANGSCLRQTAPPPTRKRSSLGELRALEYGADTEPLYNTQHLFICSHARATSSLSPFGVGGAKNVQRQDDEQAREQKPNRHQYFQPAAKDDAPSLQQTRRSV